MITETIEIALDVETSALPPVAYRCKKCNRVYCVCNRHPHSTVAHVLEVAGIPATDLGDAGFNIPRFSQFDMPTAEAVRWLADLGIRL